jgi:hypothetical protein
MAFDASVGQLSQKMDNLQNIWGLSADYSNDSHAEGDVLQRCSIGDVDIISKLKPRQMQTFADSTSALGLRVVGVLSTLLEQQVNAPQPSFCFLPSLVPQLPFSNETAVSAALLKSQSGDGALDSSSFVSVGLWHRVRKLNIRLHKRHGGVAAAPASLNLADAPASASSSDAGSSDSETEGVPALLPFKADAAHTANGALLVSFGTLVSSALCDCSILPRPTPTLRLSSILSPQISKQYLPRKQPMQRLPHASSMPSATAPASAAPCSMVLPWPRS